MASTKPIIGISCGDLNGIGMEIIMKTFANKDMLELCTPVVFASSKVASYHRKAIDLSDFNFNSINSLEQLRHGRANLLNSWQEEVILEFGKASRLVGDYALQSLEKACQAYEQKKIDALVTAPIHKNTIQSDRFQFTGHTDYLEARFKGRSMMMMVSPEMRIALATVHIPIAAVAERITKDLLIKKINQINQSLEFDFHLKKGKIAVLSLNPHAGDGGIIGNEDDEVVAPAIGQAFEEGKMVFGPFPADSFFGANKHQNYDGILAMYHDQGLVAFKSLSFGQGVNYTAGLPIIRTSPDHGTGFDIAGKGLASESSFRQAVYLACDLVKNRSLSAEASKNPLTVKKGKRER